MGTKRRGNAKNIRIPQPPAGWHVRTPDKAKSDLDYWVRDGYRLVRCPGAAHSNPYIDSCTQCAPAWGWLAVPELREGDRVEVIGETNEESDRGTVVAVQDGRVLIHWKDAADKFWEEDLARIYPEEG